MRLNRITAVAAAALSAALSTALVAAPARADAQPLPGRYLIGAEHGGCLRNGGGFNEKTFVGPCDTTWALTREHRGYSIRHEGTDHCLGVALERIYPPRTATLPCGHAGTGEWHFVERGPHLELILGDDALTEAERGAPTLLLPAGRAQGQHWYLRRV
ncbi:hypothetical protein [Actinomadura atramentaria]|uniref:hypothetical protein n=1 Tax=Actinomadura atramentaria TaxID=1990 RepID=UPI00038257F1|nr:hypothetical protein [Actinomadura atramentaria]